MVTLFKYLSGLIMTANQPKLQIKIDNKKDIELFEFTSSMASINDQYNRFLTQNKKEKSRPDCKLYVNRVAEGSVIIDLCEKAPETLPMIAPFLVEYSSFLIQTLDYMCGKSKTLPPYKFFKEDYTNIKKILQPVTNVIGNTINFKVLNFESKTIVVNNTYNCENAKKAIEKCDDKIESLKRAGDSLLKENINLDLYQARDSNLSVSSKGNLGIISEISDKPQVLSFATKRLRYDITKAESNPFNFTFSVDIEIKLKEGSLSLESYKDIKEYEILKLHGPIEKSDLFDE